MIPKNYSLASVKRLSRLVLPAMNEPVELKLLWLRALSSEDGRNEIIRKCHKHSFFEAHFLIFGDMEYECGGEIYKLDENSALLFPPECEHTVKEISGDFLKFSVAFLTESAAFDRARATLCRTHGLSHELDAILSYAEERPPFYDCLIRDRVFALLTSLMCKGSESNAVRTSTSDTRVIAAKKYIEDNVGLFLTCEDVARYCHFNAKYLNRLFREETGKTLLDYIHDTKTHAAEKLLTETELTLSEISATLGFENEYYFNSFFKRRSGISPGLYRKLRLKR